MLDKVSVSLKLYLLLFITASSLVGLGLYNIVDVKKMDENTHSLYADRVLPIQQLSDIRFAYSVEIIPMAQKVNNHLLTFKKAKEELFQAQETINTNWQAYKLTYLTPQESLLVKQTDALKKQVDEACAALQIILDREDIIALDRFARQQFIADPDPFFTKLSRLMSLQVQVGKELMASNNEIYRATVKKIFFLIVCTLVLSLSISLFIVKNIKGLFTNILNSNKLIKESEEQYRSLFEQASDAIFIMNAKGDFTQLNDSMCKIVGYNRDKLLTMNVRDLLNDELLQLNPLVYNQRAIGETVIGERKFVHRNGRVVDIEINGKKFTEERMVVMFRDITERKEMEAELRDAEIKFRTLADKSMVGIYMVQNGKFVYVNPRFAEVFGYEPHELIGAHSVEVIIHPDFQAIAAENVRARLEDGKESVHYEAMGRKKDGSANWIEFYGSRAVLDGVPTIIGSMIDITERKSAEEELRSSEQKYKLLFERNPVPLCMVAKDDLSIIAVNQTAADLYGYTKDEMLNASAAIVRLKEDIEQQREYFSLGVNGPTDRGVVRHVKKDGTIIFVNVIVNDILFEGRIVRLVLSNDITEKLKAEEMLKTTEANLETILNNTDTAYALLNSDLDILAYNNKALIFAENEFNFDPKGKERIFDMMPENRRVQFLDYTNKVFEGSTISYEVSYPQPGNKDIWYYVRMFPISDKDDKILGLVLAITDVTERKEAEHSLQSAYEQIKTNIIFIREIIWKQSHILRSPLANLKGLMTILRADPSDEEVLSYIEIEFNRMDTVLMEMAESSSGEGMSL